MRHFFTKSTVEARIYCKRCGKDTMWRISGGRPAYCQACYGKSEPAKESVPEVEKSGDLFGGKV